MKTPIVTDQAPAAIGPYSQGISTESLVFVSGQLPIDPATGVMPEDVAAQAKSYGRGENLRLSTGRSQDVAAEDEETHDCLEAFFTALYHIFRWF